VVAETESIGLDFKTEDTDSCITN